MLDDSEGPLEARQWQDIQAVGYLMTAVMEPGTSFAKPNTIELQFPEKWKPYVLQFLQKTTSKNLQNLLQDDFLRLSPGSGCLIPHVWIAERTVYKEWDLCKVQEISV
ncbi:MAG: hypothetical protein M1834_000925 [Cirrosporium novae-zelandiae]|nr:MAG: hypothetical protein M1834_000925 [Cirrosporium novae-zelandiae]